MIASVTPFCIIARLRPRSITHIVIDEEQVGEERFDAQVRLTTEMGSDLKYSSLLKVMYSRTH